MTTEIEYLKNYDSTQYKSPITTVDSVLLSIHNDELSVLLVKRANHPFKGFWGLAGGFVNLEEDVSTVACAARNLAEKTGVVPPYLNELTIRSGAERDPRGWTISIGYYALVAYESCESHIDTVSDVRWCPLKDLADYALAFDHADFIEEAIRRLRHDAVKTLIAAHTLPEQFSLSALQKAHEVILSRSLNKKSFHRRIETANVLEEVGVSRPDSGRPAKLFKVRPELDNYEFRCGLDI